MEMIERILSKENMALAYKRVMRNQGCGGVDGMEVPELLLYLIRHWESVKPSNRFSSDCLILNFLSEVMDSGKEGVHIRRLNKL